MSFFKFHPSPAAQFRDSTREFKRLPSLVLAALFIALNLALSLVRIDVMPGLRMGFGYLTQALTGLLFGPVVAMVTGVLGDEIGYFLRPDGPYFPGYALTALLGGLLYGLFLYHRPLKLWRVAAAKVSVTLVCNVVLNTLWGSMLYGGSFAVLLPARMIKNVILLPVEVLLLFMVSKIALQVQSRVVLRRT